MCTHAGKGGEITTTVTTLTQPEGELLLGLPTLLTMHRVNAEVKRTQKKPKPLNQPIVSYKQPQAFNCIVWLARFLLLCLFCHFSFGPVKRREGGCMHKEVWQRVYVGIRHMHREHFVFSKPTCALRAPFVVHTLQPCFYLCRRNAGVAPPHEDTTETALTF